MCARHRKKALLAAVKYSTGAGNDALLIVLGSFGTLSHPLAYFDRSKTRQAGYSRMIHCRRWSAMAHRELVMHLN